MAAANIISIIGTGISLLSFLQSNFPSNDNDGGSKLRFAIGIDGTASPDTGECCLSNAGGDIPDILLFNELGEYIGYNYDPGNANQGNSNYEVDVPQDGFEGQQPTYVVLAANDDAICISYISQTWPGGENFGWTGDWGYGCPGDHTWFWSNTIINDQEPHKPKCIWLDKNGDQPAAGLQIHFPDFIEPENGGGYSSDLNYYCNTASLNWRFTADDHTVTYYDPPRQYNKKRSLSSRFFQPETTKVASGPKVRFTREDRAELKPNVKAFLNGETFFSNDSRLVVSSDPQHDPTELCTSRNSAGPDFANPYYGLFCDMHTKTLKPICQGSQTDDCFSLNTDNQFARGAESALSKYTQVIEWE